MSRETPRGVRGAARLLALVFRPLMSLGLVRKCGVVAASVLVQKFVVS